jgi:site-specific DNA-adenine methylase
MNNYIGNKDFSNVIHFLVNRLPKSKNYYSLFYGSGGLEKSIYTADAKFICAERNPDCKKHETSMTATIEYLDYKDLIEENVFTPDDFVFADPPYMFSTRRAGKKYYKFEFNLEDHKGFLRRMLSLPCRVMITHPECDLYNEYLKGWKRVDLKYMTQQGWFTDSVYMNYEPENIELLNYDCLGKDFTDRQRIKRQRKNIINKFKNLDPSILKAVVRDLKEESLI